MTKKEELKEKIKQAEQLVDNLKSELEILEKEPEFKRVNLGESFYMIDTRFGTMASTQCTEEDFIFDNMCFACNNYFHTKERALEVLNKIKFLLKMERFYDTYCPDYKPDWNLSTNKYYLFYNNRLEKYTACCTEDYKLPIDTYFPDQKTAEKVCDKLNEELKNKS